MAASSTRVLKSRDIMLYAHNQAVDFGVANVRPFEVLSVASTGRIASARGAQVQFTASASSESDTSTQIQVRADAGYSTEIGRNLQIVSDEMDTVAGQGERRRELAQLLQMWTWVGRVEQLRSRQRWPSPGSAGTTTASSSSWHLAGSGVRSLLGGDTFSAKAGSSEDSVWDNSLSCTVYRSIGRQLVLRACGWGAQQESSSTIDGADEGDLATLEQAMQDSEAVGDYERSAALAVFHGELRAAVLALKKAQDYLCLDFAGGGGRRDADDVQQLLQLVAMSIAGYSNPPPTGNQRTHGANVLWQEMCRTLLQHPLLAEMRTSHPYLRTICVFLLFVSELFAVGGDASELPSETRWFSEILYDEQISLEDRTAFACRFLPSGQLQGFLDYQLSYTTKNGRLDGVMLLGLGSEGQDLLQVRHLLMCLLCFCEFVLTP